MTDRPERLAAAIAELEPDRDPEEVRALAGQIDGEAAAREAADAFSPKTFVADPAELRRLGRMVG